LQLKFPYINSAKRPLVLDSDIKDPNWLAGITSGEGCLFV
jgi:hypothetical protein